MEQGGGGSSCAKALEQAQSDGSTAYRDGVALERTDDSVTVIGWQATCRCKSRNYVRFGCGMRKVSS